MGNKYVVESQFEDLHGNPADEPDLELDVSDSENPIIAAALSGADDSWEPPEDDDKEKPKKKVDDDEDDEDDDLEDDLEDEDDSDEEDDDDEDEPEDDEPEDDEDDDDEDEKYSKKVQKRIDRERELRRVAEQKADARIRKMERRMKLRDAKDDLRDEERKADSKLRKLRKQKVDALEEGETAKAVDIDEEILDIKSELKTKQAEVKQLEDNIDTDDGEDAGVPAKGQEWLAKYPEFHTNAQFKDVVLSADRMVARRGLDKNTDKYYEEIEKIIEVQFPEIVKPRTVKRRTKKKKTTRRKKPAVGGTQRAGTRKRTSSKRRSVIRLTKTDQEQMRNFGLDPKNPVHAKEWAANKTDD